MNGPNIYSNIFHNDYNDTYLDLDLLPDYADADLREIELEFEHINDRD